MRLIYPNSPAKFPEQGIHMTDANLSKIYKLKNAQLPGLEYGQISA
jgi:hypothetical protein